MAPTPSSSKSHTPHSKQNQNLTKTPQSKHRLNFGAKENNPLSEHPVEVIGRIRDNTNSESVLNIISDKNLIRVKTDIGYRDFSLDGVSSSENQDLDDFYKKFIETRINGVKTGDKCTVMMYGPTGSGKSYTMFGSGKQFGIVYRSLRSILGEEESDDGVGSFVQVSVLEIYNEEIYDLLATNGGGGFGLGWSSKGNTSKVKLEVMGKKAKNATFISGTEAGKISKEIQRLKNEGSLKVHYVMKGAPVATAWYKIYIILDVPTVGGRLMLVDMAGSENIEQAGQIGFEAKIQTGKINQGNIALKRVVESIANGDSHVPFRDSKLTMLLQDSFEDDKSKILMILCASPDLKEIHKTISTLEYGAKAKCIVRGPHTPVKDKHANEESVLAMNQFVLKLQMENKIKEKERIEAHKELMKKEDEISALRAKLSKVEEREAGNSEEEINMKVNERTQMIKQELERKIVECERMVSEYVELERRKMEETILQQQKEVETLRTRLEEIELELRRSKERNGEEYKPNDEIDGNGFAKKLLERYGDEDTGMIESMDLDKSMDLEKPIIANNIAITSNMFSWDSVNTISRLKEEAAIFTPRKLPLTTVFEEEEEEEDKENLGDKEVQKEVIEEKTVSLDMNFQKLDYLGEEPKITKSPVYNRDERIANIFTLCGNYRELSTKQNGTTPVKTFGNEYKDCLVSPKKSPKYKTGDFDINDLKENNVSLSQVVNCCDEVEVYVKWESSKGKNGKLIATLKVVKDATLADLRKLIEIYFGADKSQGFSFLTLEDPAGAPLSKEKESTLPVSKLPISKQPKGHLACLRPITKGNLIHSNQHPFTPLQNILNVTAAR